DTTVKVFLYCNSSGGVMPVQLRPADRVVPDDGEPLRAALTQLLLGVTPAEEDAGLGSAFSSSTAGGLRGVTVRSGIARLDLTAGFESTNNFSTTNHLREPGVVYRVRLPDGEPERVTDGHGASVSPDGRRWL
ncbi:MAG: GerMN domain-containing protein, partial [Acidimicrobiia bacterium]